MLKEVDEMEKKPFARTIAVNAKSAAADVKPKQDSGNHGKVNRANWKREVQPKQHSRPEVSRKPSPQKSKTFDNRPKPRGNVSHDYDWTEIARCESVEVGSPLKPGSRKLNLNHLLNFKYLPRDTTGTWVGSRYQEGHHGNRGPIWTPRKHKYNKEQFLQANCQFVVQESGDYQVHACDPDLLVDWKYIEQVRLLSHEVPSCPICLYPPVAAKITRCGHIYCWPCVLHYLALSDKSWRKCPICFEAVHKVDLKSVVALPAHQYITGEEISMQLMKRERGSVLAMPKLSWRPTNGRPLQVCDDDMRFSKLLLASKEEVLQKIISRERSELAAALDADPHCPESCFIETALQNLGERNEHLGLAALDGEMKDKVVGGVNVVKNIANVDSGDEKLNLLDGKDTVSTSLDVSAGSRRRDESVSTDSLDGFAFEEELEVSDPKCTLPSKSGGCNPGKDTYYFYQASDGQHVYLHSLNVRILVQQYGSLEHCPDVINAKIVAKEGTSMSDIARNRLRYLSHLPLTAEFEVVELSLNSPLVSKAVIDSFAAEIEGRQRKRNRRERDENRRERYMQLEANKKMGKFPVARLHLDSFAQFPTCQSADEILSVDVPTLEESPRSSPSSPVCFPESKPNKDKERRDATPSFAQMLRNGKCNVPKTMPCSPQRTTPMAKEMKRPENSDSDSEGYVHAPEFHLSFGEAIQAAMDKAALASTEDSGHALNKKKKKKGRQKLLLFSNAVVRGN